MRRGSRDGDLPPTTHRQTDRRTNTFGSLPARRLLDKFGLAFFIVVLRFLLLQSGDRTGDLQALLRALYADVASVSSQINQMFLFLAQKANRGGICYPFTTSRLLSQTLPPLRTAADAKERKG